MTFSLVITHWLTAMSYPKNRCLFSAHWLGTLFSAIAIILQGTIELATTVYVRLKQKVIVLKRYAKFLKYSSTVCVVAGGVLLASNVPASRFGFIFLALSSAQLLLASLAECDRTTTFYAVSLFICVDCLGIYRWIYLT